MTITRYRYYPRSYRVQQDNRPQRATLWALVLVVVATVIALTFGSADGQVSQPPIDQRQATVLQ